MKLTDRMRQAMDTAGFSVSDMALWFGVSRTSMCTWLGKTREWHTPKTNKHRQLSELVDLLLSCTPGQLPIGLDVRQSERRALIQRVKQDAIKKVSKPSLSPKRPEMLDDHKPRQKGRTKLR